MSKIGPARRALPSPSPHVRVAAINAPMDLYTIPFSHFCEKARWGLAYYGVPYREHKFLPMLHLLPMLWQSRGKGKFDRHSTPASTPMLRTELGQRVCDSSLILAYLSTRFGRPPGDLYPNPNARDLERLFSMSLGPDARRVAYYFVLQHQELALDICSHNAPGFQTALIDAVYGTWYAAMRKALLINPKRTKQSILSVDESFTLVDAKLADGRPYLCGARFSAADLTFAALAAPALWISQAEGYGGYLSPRKMLPDALSSLVERWRGRPAGRFALRMFQEHKPQIRWVG